MNAISSSCLALASFALIGLPSCSSSLVHVQPATPRKDKKALLVLPGLRNSPRGQIAAKKWYPGRIYDVFIPDYVSREGFDGSVANLEALIDEHRLEEYGEVCAFVYLMGGWTLNKYLETHEFGNLRKIVYDRSPYQEQAPRIFLENIPGIVHLLFGTAVDQMRDTPYPTLPKGDRKIGLLIENRATPYIRRHRDQLHPIGPGDWLPDAFGQEHDDRMHVFLHHDEIYYRLDEFGDELISFFETGRFTDEAARDPIDRNSFE